MFIPYNAAQINRALIEIPTANTSAERKFTLLNLRRTSSLLTLSPIIRSQTCIRPLPTNSNKRKILDDEEKFNGQQSSSQQGPIPKKSKPSIFVRCPPNLSVSVKTSPHFDIHMVPTTTDYNPISALKKLQEENNRIMRENTILRHCIFHLRNKVK